MRITGPGISGPPPDRAAARALLRRAVELGVQLIDTADVWPRRVRGAHRRSSLALRRPPHRDEGRLRTRRARRFLGEWRADRLDPQRPPRASPLRLRGIAAPAQTQPHRPLPTTLPRPSRPLLIVDRRTQRAPERGKDPPHRR